MRATYDSKAKALYVYIEEGKIEVTYEWMPGINVDIGPSGETIGIEYLFPESLEILGEVKPKLESPIDFLFGFVTFAGSPYVVLVAEAYWKEHGYVHDQSSYHSGERVISWDQHPQNEEVKLLEQFEKWFYEATALLGGEAMESHYEILGSKEETTKVLEEADMKTTKEFQTWCDKVSD